jgi:phosphoribosylformimino-5-aminoimidazole carboxamide ribotide isomerase
MTIIPAIDLLGGVCVRLTRGKYDQVQRYATDPVEVAQEFESAGAGWLHLVDLDAARGTLDTVGSDAERYNRGLIRKIVQAVHCQIEVGGGIRNREDVDWLLESGTDRLIVSTVLVRSPEKVRRWCASYPGVIWAGIDAHEGVVKVAGWQQEAALYDVELAARVREMGLGGIVYTSIGRDGTLKGPDIERTNRIAEVSGLPVILSGGIGSLEDVQRVEEQRRKGVQGLIIGKAIYQGRVNLPSLFELF